MTGRVFNVQRFSLHDGPGIRTTVFLMGCSLSCRWCHNPEGQDSRIRLQYDKKKCIGCGACQAVCPQGVHRLDGAEHIVRFSACTGCGKCVEACPAKALSFSGREYTPWELAEQVARDLPFFQDSGGVTFSGGEPLLQAEFLREAAKLCRELGVPTVAVDTAGLLPRSAFETVLPWVDHFLFDIKAATERIHIAGTGASNRQILENLRWLDQQEKNLYIRVPVIPGWNDDEEEIHKISQIAHSLSSLRELRLIPYHTFGREKYAALGDPEPEPFPVPEEEAMNRLRKIAEK